MGEDVAVVAEGAEVVGVEHEGELFASVGAFFDGAYVVYFGG